jgi:hypothetical protein
VIAIDLEHQDLCVALTRDQPASGSISPLGRLIVMQQA